MKEGAFSSSRSLKQGVWGHSPPEHTGLEEQNDVNHKICIYCICIAMYNSHNISQVRLTKGTWITGLQVWWVKSMIRYSYIATEFLCASVKLPIMGL